MQQIQLPPLSEGEIYVGAIGDKNGDFYHVILLPGDNGEGTWQAQMDWAKNIGGDLPNRIEQSMLWANHRDQFKQDWYWSNETYHRNDAYAWYQGFLNGYQFIHPQGPLRLPRACRPQIVDLIIHPLTTEYRNDYHA